MFFAPFNLTILKLVVNIHDIKIDDHHLLHISVCDLHDFNEKKDGKEVEYHPFTPFS